MEQRYRHLVVLADSYLNPNYNKEKADKLYEKQQHCHEVYHQFLKEKKELGCIEG